MNHALLFNISTTKEVRRFLGPHRIATYLREQEWDAEVVDFTWYWTDEQLDTFCNSRITNDTKFIAFSCFFGFWNSRWDNFVERLKKTYPNIKIVWGSHSYPRFDNPNIDYFVVGYGEKAMLELIKLILGNSNIVAFDPRFFGKKKVISALDSYPSYPMSSLNVIYEDRDFIDQREWLSVELSRGCKFSCTFCNFPILGVKSDYSRDAKDFSYQMKDAYDRFGVENYYVADETFNETTEKLEKFAVEADKFNFNLRMHGFIRADLIVANKNTWDQLIRLGFFGHYYGIETFNKKTGSSIGKGMSPVKLQEGLLEIKDYFGKYAPYRGVVSLICGLPHETIETFTKGIEWCHKNWQGQNTTVFPLDIPLDPLDVKLSYISQNYKELGYRQSTDPWIAPDEMQYAFGRSNLDWENDHMNLKIAKSLVDDARGKLWPNTGVSIWQYGDYIFDPNLDLEKISKITSSKYGFSNHVETFFDSYIEKKLNWTKK